MDKEVHRVKSTLRDRLSDLIYDGFWFSPEACYVKKCIALSQEDVTGTVKLELYKGNGLQTLLLHQFILFIFYLFLVYVLGRCSPTSIYNQSLVSMDKHDDFTPSDATGFINIHAIRLKEYSRAHRKKDGC